jgi:hypothetical protein
MKACLGCNKEADNLKRCGSCHVAYFCNEQCQRKAWPNHRLTCKKLADSNAQHDKFDLVVGPGTAQKLNHACTLYRFANLQKFNPEIAAKEHVFIECEPESPIGRFLTSTQNTDRREQCKPLYLDKSTIYIFSMDFIKVLDGGFGDISASKVIESHRAKNPDAHISLKFFNNEETAFYQIPKKID